MFDPPRVASRRVRAGNLLRRSGRYFDIYVGKGFERSSNDQLAFFRKHLAA